MEPLEVQYSALGKLDKDPACSFPAAPHSFQNTLDAWAKS